MNKLVYKILIAVLISFSFIYAWQSITNVQGENTPHSIGEYDYVAFRVMHPIFRFQDEKSTCTAFVISDYIALTAAHCLINKTRLIKTNDFQVFDSVGADLKMSVKAVKVLLDLDLGVVSGDFRNFQRLAVDWVGLYTPKFGDVMMACGFPNGQDNLQCFPHILVDYIGYDYYTQGLMIKGMSGGPTTFRGMVVGINTKTDGVSMAWIAPLLKTKDSLGLHD